MTETMAETAAKTAAGHDPVAATRRGRAIFAAILGNMLTWYDLALYGFFLPELSRLFFPVEDGLAQWIAMVIIGFGFAMRPVGAALIGSFGDRYGRRRALAAALGLMSLASAAIGAVPTYERIGILAPLLLLLIRMAQGMAVGAEWGGATCYLVEFARPGRRGYLGSWQPVSVGLGLLLGSALVRLLHQETVLPHDALLAWGWRLPFLFGSLVGIVAILLRWGLPETPRFAALDAAGGVVAAPLHDAATRDRAATCRLFGIALHNTAAYYLVLVYMMNHLVHVAGMDTADALTINTLGLVVYVASLPAMGALSDRLGRKRLLMGSCILYVVLAVPLFWLISLGGFWLTLFADLALVLTLALFAGPAPATFAELFPSRVRYTGLAVGYALAAALFGGCAPLIARALSAATGEPLAPAAYLAAAAFVTLLVLRPARETAFAPLE